MCRQCIRGAKYEDLVIQFENDPRFRYLNAGSTRATFEHIGKGYVVKIAFRNAKDHQTEYQYYRKYGKFGGAIPVARCRLMKDPRILVMEKVSNTNTCHQALEKYPERDGRQGGYDSKGRAVFYDYGWT